MDKYNIIYMDPPWFFNQRKNSKTLFWWGITNKYPVMKIQEIEKIPIPELAADNCSLFMWVTTSKTPDSDIVDKLDLMRKWWFKIVNMWFNWKKQYKNWKTMFWIGYYTKSGSELCFLWIKWKMKPVSNRVSSIIESEIGKHSEKPKEVREKIVELFWDLPRIELFARERVKWWDSFGNEIKGSIDLTILD